VRLALERLLPRPGPLWGAAPQRPAEDAAPPWRWPAFGGPARQAARVAAAAARESSGWRAMAASPWGRSLAMLRRDLRRDGLGPASQARVLGAVAAVAARVLGIEPYPSQLFAAAALLDGRMAEMATGEGKTLATALAAAAAALAGMPVHVATANDYLAARDAQALAPLFDALGLSVAHLAATLPPDARRSVYAQDVVYTTARELAFDHLRDALAVGALHEPLARTAAALAGAAPPTPLQRGLCFALLDEADSILLDEADVPLIVSRQAPHAARRAYLWQALALARRLEPGADCRLAPAERRATLTPAGATRLAALAVPLGGPWRRERYRHEVVETALVALHLLQRNRHYLLRDGAVQLLDEVTGRAAPGRVWSRGLHTVVELKEGLTPSEDTETLARSTFQRFFQRYWRLAGTSGTLWEARAELHEVYGAHTVRVPLHRPDRRRTLPTRCFATPVERLAAAVARARELHARGRPLLIGTDSVEDSLEVAQALRSAGLPARVLSALHDADEADIVAAAGRRGAVTVATRMAGRGTDIALDDGARAAGGLHALSLQRNPSRRLDRQFAGRAARHGDPGSAERLALQRFSVLRRERAGPTLPAWNFLQATAAGPAGWWLDGWLRVPQWLEERRRRALRRLLLEQDRHWENRLAFAGPPA
jgi:preprotein translocase subunit SecA